MTVDQAIQLAVQHHQANRLHEAETLYRQVLAVAPRHPVALHNLGQLAYTVRRFDLALPLITQSLVSQPNDANTRNTLAATLFAMGRVPEAKTEADLAILFNPQLAPAHSNLGNALVGLGDFAAGVKAFQKAIDIDPNNAIAHDGLGATLLMLGNLQQGWRESEWRWLKPGYEANRFTHVPRWDGSDLTGKRILLLVEQGYGDVFQFCRYAPLLKARGATVIMEVVPDIHRLLQSLHGVDELVIAGIANPQVDVAVPLLSVGLYYGTTLQTIPANTPYLSADTQLVHSFNTKYFANDPNFKVGIAWAGRPTHGNDHNRSLALSALQPLSHLDGVTLYSLQKGDACQQLQSLPPGMKVVDLSPELCDFNQTAAAIAGLDLIITVDTAVSHLAGALAKPVWVMLPFVPDWRWMLDRPDSPWYPTMRLFRQKTRGDWTSVINRITSELQNQRSTPPLVNPSVR